MKRYLLSAVAAALVAVSLVVMDSGKAEAAVGSLGPGLIYAAGTEGSDSLVSVFVRSGSTWYAGVTNISKHLAIVPTGTLSTPPFVVNIGQHVTAFVNTPVLYDGQSAQLTAIYQDWGNSSNTVTIIITSPDFSTTYKVLSGSFSGTLSVQP